MKVFGLTVTRPAPPCIVTFRDGEREVWNRDYHAPAAPAYFLLGIAGLLVGISMALSHPGLNYVISVAVLVFFSVNAVWRGAIEGFRSYRYAYSLTNYRLIVYRKRKGIKVAEIEIPNLKQRALQGVAWNEKPGEVWVTPKDPELSQDWPFKHGSERRVPGVADPTLLYALIGELRKAA